MQACLQNKGKWEWAVYMYQAMKQVGHTPDMETHDLLVQVCAGSVTRDSREKAFRSLQAAGAPAYVCFNATNACY